MLTQVEPKLKKISKGFLLSSSTCVGTELYSSDLQLSLEASGLKFSDFLRFSHKSCGNG